MASLGDDAVLPRSGGSPVAGAPETARSGLLLPATVALWAAQMIVLVGGFARSKVTALYLGPPGMGLISQLNYLTALVVTVAVFGMWNGCIKLLAEAHATGDVDQERRVRSITLFYPLVAGLLIAVAISAASRLVGHALLGPNPHAGAVIVAVLGVPASLLAGALSVGLQGHGRMMRLAMANTLIALGSTVLGISLVVAFGLRGAIAGVALTPVLGALVLVTRERGLFKGVSFRADVLFDRKVLRVISTFGVAAIVVAVASSGTDLGIRTLIVRRLGISANGLYQPVTLLSAQLFLALVSALAIYLFPRLTGLYSTGQYEQATAEVNSGIRLMLSVTVPAVILTITLAPLLLRLLFSEKFVPAKAALTWQMGGEVFRTLAWTIGAVLLPLGLIRLWVAVNLLALAVLVGLTDMLIGAFGVTGVSIAYSSSWLVNAIAASVVAYRRAQFRLDPRTLRFVVMALLLSAASIGATRLSEGVAHVTAACFLTVWLALIVRRDSVQALAAAVRGLRR